MGAIVGSQEVIAKYILELNYSFIDHEKQLLFEKSKSA